MAEPRRFPIRFSSFNGVLFRGLLISPSSARVELDDDTIHVRLGWAFAARIPRRLVAKAGLGQPPTLRLTAGAHGWGGRWLVNGSADGIVTMDLGEPVRAFVSGFPIRLKELSVSLEDPEGFLAALGAPPR
ncbi:MAG TPA: hypothetical protein VG034_27180 [Acidimicrobiia bacterium]|jgi:hypothetical protein|nr:hypothetical protein [Acidimicrobiia bacterium]